MAADLPGLAEHSEDGPEAQGNGDQDKNEDHDPAVVLPGRPLAHERAAAGHHLAEAQYQVEEGAPMSAAIAARMLPGIVGGRSTAAAAATSAAR